MCLSQNFMHMENVMLKMQPLFTGHKILVWKNMLLRRCAVGPRLIFTEQIRYTNGWTCLVHECTHAMFNHPWRRLQRQWQRTVAWRVAKWTPNLCTCRLFKTSQLMLRRTRFKPNMISSSSSSPSAWTRFHFYSFQAHSVLFLSSKESKRFFSHWWMLY